MIIIPYLIEQPVRMSTPNVTEVRRMELLQAPFTDGLIMVSQVLRSLLRKIASLTTKSRKILQHVYLAWELCPFRSEANPPKGKWITEVKTGGRGERTYSTNWPAHNFEASECLTEKHSSQYSFSGSSSRERLWIKSFQCQEILLKVKKVMAACKESCVR